MATGEGLAVRERHGDPRAHNLLVHADNEVALAWLRRRYEGKVACVYLDPPFNTGRRFAEYRDARGPGEWLAMMRPRLEALLPLLRSDGVVFAEIDDTMVGELRLLLDDVFGRERRVSTITIVRSAPTGHKAQNRGPVNVTSFLFVYEKTRGQWRYRPQVRARRGYDPAYDRWVENADGPCEGWTFRPLAQRVAEELGYASGRDARVALGKPALDQHLAAFAVEHARSVARFAQPRFEAVSKEAQSLILRSRKDRARVFRLERPGLMDLVLHAGNRVLLLERKVRTVDGRRRLVEPLTNVWDDLGFQGIAKEGGVVFSRNKKPERLLARVLSMATDPGDLVLDPFLGSGTTAATAHKMGRTWIGIEQGAHLHELCVPRLRRVVDGTDNTGISRSLAWEGGGGFAVVA